MIYHIYDKNNFQNLFDFDDNNIVYQVAKMMERTQTLPDRIDRNVQEYSLITLRPCISDNKSSNNKDNLDQNYSSKPHW